MDSMSIFWLRAAAACYAVGLIHTIWIALRKRSPLFPFALGMFRVGLVLQFVSLVELAINHHQAPVNNFYESVSVCAFLIGVAFLIVHWRYKFESAGVFLFPLVFLMTQTGAMEFPVAPWADTRVRNAWLLLHVILILVGFAALLVGAIASLFYLIQERQLKRKKPSSVFDRLPPLATLDDLVTNSMGFGFAFLTLGLIAATTWAFIESGTKWMGDVKIEISFFTWGLCLIMVYLRIIAGWRGRKAALMAIAVLGSSAVTWVAHIGLRPLLMR
jgi:ABC-type transport system involved in cytochrome c biogenesis permease subunit